MKRHYLDSYIFGILHKIIYHAVYSSTDKHRWLKLKKQRLKVKIMIGTSSKITEMRRQVIGMIDGKTECSNSCTKPPVMEALAEVVLTKPNLFPVIITTFKEVKDSIPFFGLKGTWVCHMHADKILNNLILEHSVSVILPI
mgnify:CR=1 FL=1